jgi:hypothetical protein
LEYPEDWKSGNLVQQLIVVFDSYLVFYLINCRILALRYAAKRKYLES